MAKKKEDKPFNEDLLLFAPKSSRGLKFDYPELSQIAVLKDLRPQEILFVWYYACKSSPFYNSSMPEADIIKRCIDESGIYIGEGTKRANFLAGIFPDSIKEAIPIMNNFEPNLRIILKKDAIQAILDIRKMTSLDLDSDGNNPQFETKDGDIDFNKKKTYMSMYEKREEMIPVLLKKAEYGLIDSKESKLENKNLSNSGRTYAEEYHENH